MQRAAKKTKKFKWTVEFEVAECWVADGFDLTDERAHDMLAQRLSAAYGHELKARVIKYPKALDVAKAQGFKDPISGAEQLTAERNAEKMES
jgi:hypothetical protein